MKRARPHQHIRRIKGKRIIVNKGIIKCTKHKNYNFWPFKEVPINPRTRRRYDLDNIDDVDELKRRYHDKGDKRKELDMQMKEEYLKSKEEMKRPTRPIDLDKPKHEDNINAQFFFSKKELTKVIKPHKRTITDPAFFEGNIEKISEDNPNFRKVVFTGKNEQLVAMSIPPKDDIGNEVHKNVDQFFRVEKGEGELVVNGKIHKKIGPGTGIVIPQGTWHDVKNTGKKPLKLYTVYAPPNHPKGTIDKTKKDAIAREKAAEKNGKKD